MKKILLIRFSSIGDIVLTTPVVRCLKKQIPGVEIHYLTKSANAQVIKDNPHISKVWLWDNNYASLMRELRRQKFDFIVDLHNNLRSMRVKLKLRRPAAGFPKINIEKYMAVRTKNLSWLPEQHIVDRYFSAVKSLGIVNDKQGLDYFISEGTVMPTLPDTHKGGYIAVVTGALFFTKKMPGSRLAEVCRLLNYPVILLGGKAEQYEAAEIAESAGNLTISLAGNLSLAQSALMLKNADVVITHDTGLMHIAAAFRKPIVSIWGNTVPEFGMFPYLPIGEKPSALSEVKGLPCRPCSKIGYQKCPQGHFRCMLDQDPAQIAALAKEIIPGVG